MNYLHSTIQAGFLGGKEPACQGRRCGFGPWVGKIPWSSKWPPTPVFLPGKYQGQRSLVSYSSQGPKGVRYDSATKQKTTVQTIPEQLPSEFTGFYFAYYFPQVVQAKLVSQFDNSMIYFGNTHSPLMLCSRKLYLDDILMENGTSYRLNTPFVVFKYNSSSSVSHTVVFNSATSQNVAHQAPFLWDSPGKSSGVVAILFSRGSSNPGIEPGSLALQADSLPSEIQGSPLNKQF